MSLQVQELDQNDEKPRFAVGIGASAGGLEALELLFKGTPLLDNCAFFVVTHLSPDFKSLLDELLQRHTTMNVEIAEHGKQIRPACVYIIPPKVEMVIASGRIFLKDRDRAIAQPLPIDVFFSSLALEYGSSAIAVILSGTGSDGSDAIKKVHENGGLTIVQDPKDSKFDGMPKAALATGAVSLKAMASEIGKIIAGRTSDGEGEADKPAEGSNDRRVAEIQEILEITHGTFNVDFSLYKINTIYRRILRRMTALKRESVSEYLEDLRADPEEQKKLANDLLINVTEFFRDPAAFELLRSKVIEPLVAEVQDRRAIRVWVPGCASGEEAYTIACLLYLEAHSQGVSIEPQIFATDLSGHSIERAARGIYPLSSFEGVDSEAVERCFEAYEGDQMRILPSIRRWIVFSRHNFLDDPPFTRMDLISCRNALIYLETEAQQRALSLFNFGLRHKGDLFLGPSESIGPQQDDFETIDRRWRLFRKIGSTAASGQSYRRPRQMTPKQAMRGDETPLVTHQAPSRLQPAYLELLSYAVPEGILVNRDRDVLHVFGSSGMYLHPAAGAMSNDILGMVAPQIRIALSTAFEKAASENRIVEFPRIEGPAQTAMSLRVVPLVRDDVTVSRHFLVIFDHAEAASIVPLSHSMPQPIVIEGNSFATERVEALQRDLESTRENLQSTIEEVETSNEELQSTNEELMAANEELQSTNEELQSVNEELYTVNSEYQQKNDELVDLTHQIENLMSATNIGVVFVDDRLMLKRFTTAATLVVNFIAQDIGRSLKHITHSFVDTDLPTMVLKSLRTRKPLTAKRLTKDGRSWDIKINPMRAAKGRADGAVITFYDVSSLKETEDALTERSNATRILGDLLGAHAMIQQPDFSFAMPQRGWTKVVGQDADESLGHGWLDVIVEEDRERVRNEIAIAQSEMPEAVEFLFRVATNDSDRPIRQLQMIAHRDSDDGNGGSRNWSSVIVDVEIGTPLRSGGTTSSSEKYVEAVLRAIRAPVFYVDSDLAIQYVNEAWQEANGSAANDVIGKKLSDVLDAREYRAHLPNIRRALEGERVEQAIQRNGRPADPKIDSFAYEFHRDAEGQIGGVVVQARDLSGVLSELKGIATAETTIGRSLVNSPVPCALVSLKTLKPNLVSRSFAEISGYSSLMLHQIGLGSLFTEWDGDEFIRRIRSPQVDSGPHSVKTALINRAGAQIPVNVTISVDPTNSDHALLLMTDLRPLQKAETALKSKTADLAKMNRTLEIFAAGASHEMKAPVRKIKKYADILVEDHGDALGEEGSDILGVIYRCSERLREIMDSVLELAWLERDIPEQCATDLETIMEHVLVDNSALIQRKNAKIDVSPLPQLHSDRRLLEILFGNLVRNALVHCGDKREVEIRIKEIETSDPMMAKILIEDNGPGIARQYVDRIFEPFVQCGDNLDGSGMGLALCESVAAKHGGTIELVSTSEEGSSFVVTLPRARSYAEA